MFGYLAPPAPLGECALRVQRFRLRYSRLSALIALDERQFDGRNHAFGRAVRGEGRSPNSRAIDNVVGAGISMAAVYGHPIH
jgi:hypothetical protein